MPLKETRPPGEYVEIDRWPGGVGWLAYPDEQMERASHALRVDRPSDESGSEGPADVWVIDPLRGPGVDDLLQDMGNVVGIVVLLDRHGRDAAGFARRYDVPLYLPAWIDIEVPEDVDVVRIEHGLPGTDYDLIETVDIPGWHEAALSDGRTLVVGDALGTAGYFTTADEEVGVHPFLRLTPPSALAGLTPERILTGHGMGIQDDATDALENALSGSRRRTPRLYAQLLWNLAGRPFSRDT